MSRLFISAAHKSSGKTTISIGLCAAFARRGLKVQPFKKGPDYIDPMWLGAAAGSDCINLDFNTMGVDELLNTYAHYAKGSDLCLIEGNKGLYDGLDLHGSNSNAALATHLDAPVILVIDAQGMTRGIAPLILGYQAFEPKLNISGVILNKLGGKRHEQKLRDVIEHYTDVPVVGAVHRDSDLELEERHLGLMPSNEINSALAHIQRIAQSIQSQVDCDKLIGLSKSGHLLNSNANLDEVVDNSQVTVSKQPVRIGITRDQAFGFYYPDDLHRFKVQGVELVSIDTINDEQLPQINGLFIGGGFPETQMQKLEANESLRTQIRQAIEDGLPVYAECGGLMYLTRNITWRSAKYNMVGAIPADTIMCKRPQGRGYVHLKTTMDYPWPQAATAPIDEFWAHEFHYSRLENIDPGVKFAYEVHRGAGIDGKSDGIVYKNVLGSYVHLRDVKNNRWVERFVDFVRQTKFTIKGEQSPLI